MNRKIKLFIFTVFICIISLFYINVNAEENKILINIDSPKVNENKTNKVDIYGWVMSDSPNTNIKIYVDEKEIEVSRSKREDVLNAIKGYGGVNENPTPGFITSIDLTEYSYGNHTIKLDVLDKDGKAIKSETRSFNKKVPSTLINIDSPTTYKKYENNLNIYGWVMSESKNTEVKIYIDEKEIEVSRSKREDVISAIKGYGGVNENPTPGFITSVDLTEYSYGNHTIKIRVLDSKKLTLDEKTIVFNHKKPESYILIDYPINNSTKNRNLHLQGWKMSTAKKTKLKIFIDDKEINNITIDYSKREDVISAIKGYGGKEENPNPGFSANIDLSEYNDGKHKITVKEYSKIGEYIGEESSSFTLEKYNTYLEITSPSKSDVYKTTINISGNMLSENPDAILKLDIDNNLISNEIKRESNNDFLKDKNISLYGGIDINKTPKFSLTYDTSKLTDGKHYLNAEIMLPNGEVIKRVSNEFNIKKYDGIITLDFPSSSNINQSNELFIRGWRMSEDPNDSIEIYVDNTKLDTSYVERQDVLNAIKNYGGTNTNTIPGFQTSVPTKNFGIGSHTIKINNLNNMGEVITTYTKNIYIYDKMMFGIDVSAWNKNIDWNTVKASQAVDFAYIRIGFRGYGDQGIMKEDSKFANNFRGANNAGIKTGLYFFSQAINYNEGVAEADFVYRTLAMYPGFINNVKLPVAIDVESSSEGHGNGRADKIEDKTDAVRGFADEIKKYGLTPIIYCSTDYIDKHLNMNRLSDVDVWLAHWTYDIGKQPTYPGTFTSWQYSNSGTITGIPTIVDLDLSYKVY